MASIKDLKRDINSALGALIEQVYAFEAETGQAGSDEGTVIIDQTIALFDELMQRIHQKDVADKKAHYRAIRKELSERTAALLSSLHELSPRS